MIVVKFMVDSHHFLLEALAWIDNNTFPFQKNFKTTCDLLPPPAHACFLPFEQFIRQQMVQLQNSILEHLHHHTFSNMFSKRILEAHRAWLSSSSSPRVGIWLIIRPIFPTFRLSFPVFSITLCMQLGLPHPSMCVHTSHWPDGYPLFTLCS